jgi:manganese transport protein
MRLIEALVLVLVATTGVCYYIQLFVLPQTIPDFADMGRALIHPTLAWPGMVYIAIGIIGATVMPHNLYLHSALVQSRRFGADEAPIRRAIRFNTSTPSSPCRLLFSSTRPSWSWPRRSFSAATA